MAAQFAFSEPPAAAHAPHAPDYDAEQPTDQDVTRLTDLLRLQEFSEGVAAAERFSKSWPQHPMGWTVLGMCLTALGAFQEAEPALQQAVPLAPDNAAVANCLGVVLKALGRPAEARKVFEQALRCDARFVEARFNLALSLRDLDLHDGAIRELRAVLSSFPQDMAARNELANALKETGAMDEAIAEYRLLLEHAPSRPEALYQLSTLKTFTRGDADLKTIQALLNRKPQRANDRIFLNFAAGKALQDVNDDPDAAFAHYHTANSLKRSSLRYDVLQDVSSFAKVQQHFATAQSVVPAPWAAGFGPAPIFIVGMPRSGATLIEQILASHPQVHGGGERKDLERSAKAFESKSGVPFPAWEDILGAPEAEAIGQDYLRALQAAAPGAQFVTDKGHKNLKLLGIVAKALPDAKIIHVRRQPLDVCFSCYGHLFSEGHAFCYDLNDLAAYFNAFDTLARHWEAILPSSQWQAVDYETLIAQPEDTIKALLDFCGLDWTATCLNFHNNARPVKTPSAVQVRQPIYRASVGRWQPYEAHLNPLIQGLSNGATWVPGSAIC